MPKATKRNSTKTDIDRLAALSKRDCPVRAIMRQAVAVRKARHELDAIPGDNDHADELWDTQGILLNMASITRAESLQGALFQLGLLMETVHVDLFQNIPSKELQDDLLESEQKAMRLLQSAASVIERIIGEEAAAVAKDVWLSDDNLSKIERAANGACAA